MPPARRDADPAEPNLYKIKEAVLRLDATPTVEYREHPGNTLSTGLVAWGMYLPVLPIRLQIVARAAAGVATTGARPVMVAIRRSRLHDTEVLTVPSDKFASGGAFAGYLHQQGYIECQVIDPALFGVLIRMQALAANLRQAVLEVGRHALQDGSSEWVWTDGTYLHESAEGVLTQRTDRDARMYWDSSRWVAHRMAAAPAPPLTWAATASSDAAKVALRSYLARIRDFMGAANWHVPYLVASQAILALRYSHLARARIPLPILVVVGPYGIGKTNLVAAVLAACACESLRIGGLITESALAEDIAMFHDLPVIWNDPGVLYPGIIRALFDGEARKTRDAVQQLRCGFVITCNYEALEKSALDEAHHSRMVCIELKGGTVAPEQHQALGAAAATAPELFPIMLAASRVCTDGLAAKMRGWAAAPVFTAGTQLDVRMRLSIELVSDVARQLMAWCAEPERHGTETLLAAVQRTVLPGNRIPSAGLAMLWTHIEAAKVSWRAGGPWMGLQHMAGGTVLCVHPATVVPDTAPQHGATRSVLVRYLKSVAVPAHSMSTHHQRTNLWMYHVPWATLWKLFQQHGMVGAEEPAFALDEFCPTYNDPEPPLAHVVGRDAEAAAAPPASKRQHREVVPLSTLHAPQTRLEQLLAASRERAPVGEAGAPPAGAGLGSWGAGALPVPIVRTAAREVPHGAQILHSQGSEPPGP